MSQLRRGIGLAWLGGVLLSLSAAVGAAELSVFSGGAVKPALSIAAANYARAGGHAVKLDYAPMGPLLRRLGAGERADVLILSREAMTEAEGKGWVVKDSARPLGGVGVGVAIKEGAAAPDISTPEALKKTLLAAKSLIYIDPEKGTSGKHVAEVLRRLGIFDAMQARTTLGDAGYVVEPVARGEIELGIHQITEILPVPGVRLLGPLPAPLQKISVYWVGLSPQAGDVAAAQAFLAYLQGAEVRGVFAAKGFMPAAASGD